ncbi:MAG: hypothetical protein ACYDHH_08680 [Solirubrobacteraceae bacterium]
MIAKHTQHIANAEEVSLALKPTAKARVILRRRGKLTTTVEIVYTPTGGEPSTRTIKVTLIRHKPR